jgi:hypothetical protein
MWVPPLRRDVALLLDRAKNPFFEHAEAEYFLAERDGAVVGRIAASQRLHNQVHEDGRPASSSPGRRLRPRLRDGVGWLAVDSTRYAARPHFHQ